jgi:hypothetical protein
MPRIIESTPLSLYGVIVGPHLWASPRFVGEGATLHRAGAN